MQHSSSTVSFDSFNSYKRSTEKQFPGLIQTNSGHLHFIERRVTLGLQTLKENESVATLTDVVPKSKPLKSPRRTRSEGNLSVSKVGEYLGFLNKAPVLGEQRTVILDMQWTKFGFQLQSYGRMSNRGKQQQSIVQNVTMGSPAFMAGLHQGDAIIEINGEDVRCSTPDEIVDKIMNTKETRIHLVVEFLDGVRRNTLRRKQSELKQQLSEKQELLKKLLSSKQCLTSHEGVVKSPSNDRIVTIHSFLPIENDDSKMADSDKQSIDPNDTCLALYTGDVLSLASDILVIPVGNPIFESNNESNCERVITQLLHAGGDKLINELSLSPYCPLGCVISTSGGKLKGIRNIYHCVFGSTDDHVIKCFYAAIEKAIEKEASSIAFWVDGFFAASVSPYKVIEMLSTVSKNLMTRNNLKIIIVSSTVSDLNRVVKEYFEK